uniref:PDI-like n=1 Tax=Oryza sativa subsp. japonica TaxID=39947 RepID=Q67VY0_ORYSJ|nr:PDI-like [Oryza sativa Japonica Group]
MATSSRAGGTPQSTPQKPDHPPTRCRSQAKVWFRRHCFFQSLVRARDQKRGSESNSGAEKEKLTPGKKRGTRIGLAASLSIRRKNVDALLRRESWERENVDALLRRESWERGLVAAKG